MASRSRRILVTGAGGFVGRVAVTALGAEGYEVVATGRRPSSSVQELDVTDADACREAVAKARPDGVLHLAGMTYLPAVLERQQESFDVNVLGTLNVLAAVAAAAPAARVLSISTCSVFGLVEEGDLPLGEDAPLRAMHPYGVQKIGGEVLCRRYRERGLDVVVVRPFNHIGPGLHERLSVAHFARQIVDAEEGVREPVLKVGNLTARRDFTDVRDVVRAYLALLCLEQPPPLVHVASGVSIPMSEVLETLCSQARVSLSVETDPSRLRPLDTPDLVGDASLLRERCGWAPRFPIAECLSRVLASVRGEDYGGDW